ncbi:hypothetical protein JCM16814_29920 [Desulfobaculum senezii]
MENAQKWSRLFRPFGGTTEDWFSGMITHGFMDDAGEKAKQSVPSRERLRAAENRRRYPRLNEKAQKGSRLFGRFGGTTEGDWFSGMIAYGLMDNAGKKPSRVCRAEKDYARQRIADGIPG